MAKPRQFAARVALSAAATPVCTNATISSQHCGLQAAKSARGRFLSLPSVLTLAPSNAAMGIALYSSNPA